MDNNLHAVSLIGGEEKENYWYKTGCLSILLICWSN